MYDGHGTIKAQIYSPCICTVAITRFVMLKKCLTITRTETVLSIQAVSQIKHQMIVRVNHSGTCSGTMVVNYYVIPLSATDRNKPHNHEPS